MDKINSFRDEYYFLSNFYEAPVTYNGLTYQNNEAAFQAQKTVDEKERILFTEMSATQARSTGRRITLRKDWEDVKIGIMCDIVEAKFRQNPDLAEKLLATGDMYLEAVRNDKSIDLEWHDGNTWGDRTWGSQHPVDVGSEPTGVKRRRVNGQGANNLGRILMEIRTLMKIRTVLSQERDLSMNDIERD